MKLTLAATAIAAIAATTFAAEHSLNCHKYDSGSLRYVVTGKSPDYREVSAINVDDDGHLTTRNGSPAAVDLFRCHPPTGFKGGKHHGQIRNNHGSCLQADDLSKSYSPLSFAPCNDNNPRLQWWASRDSRLTFLGNLNDTERNTAFTNASDVPGVSISDSQVPYALYIEVSH